MPERISATPGFCLLLALMLLSLPLPWCGAIAAAGLIHESGHLLALFLAGSRCRSLRFSAGGAVMDAAPLGFRAGVLCSLAGPAAGLIPVFFYESFPRIALCCTVQTVFNLLPLPGLDGGQVMQLCCDRLLPPRKSLRLQCMAGWGCAALLALGSGYAAQKTNLAFLPAMVLIPAVCKLQSGKNSCKTRAVRVQ